MGETTFGLLVLRDLENAVERRHGPGEVERHLGNLTRAWADWPTATAGVMRPTARTASIASA